MLPLRSAAILAQPGHRKSPAKLTGQSTLEMLTPNQVGCWWDALATEPGVLVFYWPHAERRMHKRGISKPDVKSTLMAGAVVNVEWHVFEER